MLLKKTDGRLALSLYVFLHNGSAGPRGPGAPPLRRGRECAKRELYVWFGGVWSVLG